MDTKFWGPDGWRLLHSIVTKFPNNPTTKDKETYAAFFNTIRHVLPCIYCRNSFHEYITELPVENYTNSRKDINNWLYLIHNKVNEKLRKQNLNDKKNPKYSTISRRYRIYVNDVNKQVKNTPGFNFLYSIAFNYIYTRHNMNRLRVINYKTFFNLLGLILPFYNLKLTYLSHIKRNPIIITKKCNHSLKLWLYQLELTYKTSIDNKCLCFKKTCLNIEQYKVGCKNNTCRKSK
jgi:hypothetical protein|tara:strand:+ start:420 stop:1121 length:702 start_codon:yes stop_codon:yes gene_type:complete